MSEMMQSAPLGASPIAFAFGYLGAEYCGSQIQPQSPTIQGELERALFELDWFDPQMNGRHVALCSRTDAGVNVRMNVGCVIVDTELWGQVGEEGFVNALNGRLPADIVVWAAALATSDFFPRNAISRTYRYRLQACQDWNCEVDITEFGVWCKLFEGTLDFTNFCRREQDRSNICEVLHCIPWTETGPEGEQILLGFEIRAHSFVWNVVRRIASALCLLATGKAVPSQIETALAEPAVGVDFGLSTACWLTLRLIQYASLEFDTLLSDRANSAPSAQSHSIATRAGAEGRVLQIWQAAVQREQEVELLTEWAELLNRF
jgi:tRNA pseudouridine38-40 synthase